MKNFRLLVVAAILAFVFGSATLGYAGETASSGETSVSSAIWHHHGPHGPRGGWGCGGC